MGGALVRCRAARRSPRLRMDNLTIQVTLRGSSKEEVSSHEYQHHEEHDPADCKRSREFRFHSEIT